MSAIQHCTQLNAYYQPVRRCGKVKEGKNKMLVLNNVRNKLVQRVFVPAGNRCVREDRNYDKKYVHSLA